MAAVVDFYKSQKYTTDHGILLEDDDSSSYNDLPEDPLDDDDYDEQEQETAGGEWSSGGGFHCGRDHSQHRQLFNSYNNNPVIRRDHNEPNSKPGSSWSIHLLKSQHDNDTTILSFRLVENHQEPQHKRKSKHSSPSAAAALYLQGAEILDSINAILLHRKSNDDDDDILFYVFQKNDDQPVVLLHKWNVCPYFKRLLLHHRNGPSSRPWMQAQEEATIVLKNNNNNNQPQHSSAPSYWTSSPHTVLYPDSMQKQHRNNDDDRRVTVADSFHYFRFSSISPQEIMRNEVRKEEEETENNDRGSYYFPHRERTERLFDASSAIARQEFENV